MGLEKSFLLYVSGDVETLFSLLSNTHVSLPLKNGDKAASILYDFYNGGFVCERHTAQGTYGGGLFRLEQQLREVEGLESVARNYWSHYATADPDEVRSNDGSVRRVYVNPRTAGLPAIGHYLEALTAKKVPLLFKHVSSENANAYTLRRTDKCVLYVPTERHIYRMVKELALTIPEDALDIPAPLFTRRIRPGVAHAITPNIDADVLDWFTLHTGTFPSNSYGNVMCATVTTALQQAVPVDKQDNWNASRYRPEELEKIKDHVKRLVIRQVRTEPQWSASFEAPVVKLEKL